MPHSLLSLPFEIQQEVFSYLSIQSIHSLLYMCKQLYQAILPLLVHTYRNVQSSGTRTTRSRARNLQFLRYVIVNKPGLANYVRCITIGDFSTRFDGRNWTWWDQTAHHGLQPDEKHPYHELIDNVLDEGLESWEEARRSWKHDLEHGFEDAEIALLLLACPRLCTLHFGDAYKATHLRRLFLLAGNSKGHKGPLSRLCNVYHESFQKYGGAVMFRECNIPLLRLPQMRVLECVSTKYLHHFDEEAMQTVQPRSSNVQTLLLRSLRISKGSFAMIARTCKALRSVEYIEERCFYRQHHAVCMRAMELIDELLPHVESLYSLYLDCFDCPFGARVMDDLVPFCVGGKLRQFFSLQKLTIGSQTLTGIMDNPDISKTGFDVPCVINGAMRIVNSIPESLTYLEIRECRKGALIQVQELLNTLENIKRFPRLRHIRLQVAQELEPEGVSLTHKRSWLRLEVIFQTDQHRRFDTTGLETEYIGSELYSPDIRQLWLKYRGLNKGTLGSSPKLLEIPVENVSILCGE